MYQISVKAVSMDTKKAPEQNQVGCYIPPLERSGLILTEAVGKRGEAAEDNRSEVAGAIIVNIAKIVGEMIRRNVHLYSARTRPSPGRGASSWGDLATGDCCSWRILRVLLLLLLLGQPLQVGLPGHLLLDRLVGRLPVCGLDLVLHHLLLCQYVVPGL